MSIFGRIIDAADVEKAALDTLVRWAPTYLAEVGRQNGFASSDLPAVASWAVAHDAHTRLPEQVPPAVIVVCPGLAGKPQRQGDGSYLARFALGFAVVVGADERVAKLYTAAFRVALLQHSSLGGFADGMEWLDEQYDPVPTKDRRTLNAGRAEFIVDVRDALNAKGGPVEPDASPDTPHPDWPTVSGGGAAIDPQPL